MPRIVTLQFSTAGKLYDFNAGDLELAPRDRVLVETERGVAIATVVTAPVVRSDEETPGDLTPVMRIATQEDLESLKRNARKEKDAYDFCNKRIMERGMQMKLVRVEYLFDGSKAVFYFTADGRVDFRVLVKDLAHTFHTRIEMRQIGVRDESKMVGGIGICGRELCCCSWLRDFQPVSVKMAKEQNLALNPSKISGQCGRLLCCLDYEYDTYCSLRKTLPKCGKRVCTDSVTGVVDKLNILTGNITLKLDDGKLVVVKKVDITGEAPPADTPPPRIESPVSAGRSSQRSRERQGDRLLAEVVPLVELVKADTTKPVATGEASPQRDSQPKPARKKHRTRKPGPRKPSGGTPPAGEPGGGAKE
ncbi:MAG: stage 0 sporulation family protein [Desulfuromonadales bacterium]|nr:stage 0 sporulation family protein [Desulfuromonadales bacterium]